MVIIKGKIVAIETRDCIYFDVINNDKRDGRTLNQILKDAIEIGPEYDILITAELVLRD